MRRLMVPSLINSSAAISRRLLPSQARRKIDNSTSSRAAVPEKMLSGGLGNVQ